jgi:hypothetical protein
MKRRTGPIALVLTILATIFGAAISIPSHALAHALASNPQITDSFAFAVAPSNDPANISHGYFAYKLERGSKTTGSVVVTNKSDKAITVRLAAVDAFTAQTGGTAFTTDDTKVKSTGAWIKLGEESLKLEPGASKLVYFSLTVPGSTTPGQYLGGLAAFTPDDSSTAPTGPQGSNGFGASVTIRSRYVIGVQVDVPGRWTQSLDVRSVQLEQPSTGPFIGVHIRNDGSTFLKPEGTLTLRGSNNTTIINEAITIDTFVPDTEITYPYRWSGELPQGTYQVEVDLKYGDNGRETYKGVLEVRADENDNGTEAAQAPVRVPGTIRNDEAKSNTEPEVSPMRSPASSQDVWWLWSIIAVASVLLVGALVMLVPGLSGSRKSITGS